MHDLENDAGFLLRKIHSRKRTPPPSGPDPATILAFIHAAFNRKKDAA
jgi:hypothetical protein